MLSRIHLLTEALAMIWRRNNFLCIKESHTHNMVQVRFEANSGSNECVVGFAMV